MNSYVDLHVHTTASDGSMTPSEIVKYAYSKGLKAIAITDHDTIDGVKEALKTGKELGIQVIPGVEIGVEYEKEMHMLGYFSEDNYMKISDILEQLRKSRDERNPKVINKLRDFGIDITMEEVVEEAKGKVIARPHIAQVLVKKGYVKDMGDAFKRFLGSGQIAYFKKDKISPEKAIQEIITAGGIPVLAHPTHLGLSYGELNALLTRLVKAGLKGIEVFYVDNTVEDTGNTLRLAIEHKIIATGGSDFHGKNKPNIDIGVGKGNLKIPEEALQALMTVK